MLQNAYFLAKIGADTAENEQHFAEILQKNWQLAYGLPRPEPGRAPSIASWPAIEPLPTSLSPAAGRSPGPLRRHRVSGDQERPQPVRSVRTAPPCRH